MNDGRFGRFNVNSDNGETKGNSKNEEENMEKKSKNPNSQNNNLNGTGNNQNSNLSNSGKLSSVDDPLSWRNRTPAQSPQRNKQNDSKKDNSSGNIVEGMTQLCLSTNENKDNSTVNDKLGKKAPNTATAGRVNANESELVGTSNDDGTNVVKIVTVSKTDSMDKETEKVLLNSDGAGTNGIVDISGKDKSKGETIENTEESDKTKKDDIENNTVKNDLVGSKDEMNEAISKNETPKDEKTGYVYDAAILEAELRASQQGQNPVIGDVEDMYGDDYVRENQFLETGEAGSGVDGNPNPNPNPGPMMPGVVGNGDPNDALYEVYDSPEIEQKLLGVNGRTKTPELKDINGGNDDDVSEGSIGWDRDGTFDKNIYLISLWCMCIYVLFFE